MCKLICGQKYQESDKTLIYQFIHSYVTVKEIVYSKQLRYYMLLLNKDGLCVIKY